MPGPGPVVGDTTVSETQLLPSVCSQLRGESTGAGSLRTRVLSGWRFSLHGTAWDLVSQRITECVWVRELKPTVTKPRPSHQVSDAGLAPGHRTADSPCCALSRRPHCLMLGFPTCRPQKNFTLWDQSRGKRSFSQGLLYELSGFAGTR